VTDLDGTLLRDDKTVGGRDIAALERLEGLGVCRAAATGRSLFSFLKLLSAMAMGPGLGVRLPLDYVIFSTGAGIMDYPGCRLDYMVHRPVPETREFLFRHQGGDNPDFFRRITMYRDFGTPLDGLDLSAFGRATEVLAIVPPAKGTAVIDRVREGLPDLNVIRATSPLDHASTWIEVFPATASKSRAAAWLAARLGLGAAAVVSVGNDYNDTDLLEWSGAGLVVGNAPAVLRARFKAVGSNNDCGVADAVDRCFPSPATLQAL
jgi:hydroxymethylpyrimidine pyrophosphatase-like HAD family hydrolase